MDSDSLVLLWPRLPPALTDSFFSLTEEPLEQLISACQSLLEVSPLTEANWSQTGILPMFNGLMVVLPSEPDLLPV